MSGRFAGLKSLQQPEDEEKGGVPQLAPVLEPTPTNGVARNDTTATGEDSQKPWEQTAPPAEPVKALNGRVPRSVRLAFDRQLTDAMSTLGMDVTVDLAVEALARLVIEHEDARERWLRLLWELKRRS